jgi:hypothetical protein
VLTPLEHETGRQPHLRTHLDQDDFHRNPVSQQPERWWTGHTRQQPQPNLHMHDRRLRVCSRLCLQSLWCSARRTRQPFAQATSFCTGTIFADMSAGFTGRFYRVVVSGQPVAFPVAAAGKLCGCVEKPVASPTQPVRVHRLFGHCPAPTTHPKPTAPLCLHGRCRHKPARRIALAAAPQRAPPLPIRLQFGFKRNCRCCCCCCRSGSTSTRPHSRRTLRSTEPRRDWSVGAARCRRTRGGTATPTRS